MSKKLSRPASWNVGTRISAITFILMGLTIAALLAAVTMTISSLLTERAEEGVARELRSVANTVEMFDRSVSSEARSFARLFLAELPGTFSLDGANPVDTGGKPVPALLLDGKALNQDHAAVDAFASHTAGSATLFALSGDDFVSVSTSYKNAGGERAVGVPLERNGAAYAALRQGKAHTGLAVLSGRQAIARYELLHDGAGKPVGAVRVAVDIEDDMKILKERIRAMKVGETGYFYVLNAAPGPDYGRLVIHPAKEGANIVDNTDADGHFFIREILEKKTGSIRYDWQNPGESAARMKFVEYTHLADWNWVIGGGTYLDEITQDASALRNRFIGFGLLALAVLAFLIHAILRRGVSQPLAEVRAVARRIAEGDLGARVNSRREDEMGLLSEAVDTIGASLSRVVGQVRDGAEQIAAASQQISSGNLDLCQRTEEQAASLAGAASMMDQLTATVRQNADNARQANGLALNASTVAEKGGATVDQVVKRMEAISQSSKKISDITGVIDGIAFQTNILALNAAVEAARAGEQGRGFAVVAGEVRNLAQRSAAAAREIKSLIEASNGEVDAGSQLVAAAGTTMNEVLASVGRVTGIMAEITAASQEQSKGIEHVNGVVGTMDETTQQNAALVEEASAAAQAMQDQAAELARAVRLFRIGDEAPQLGAPSGRPALARA